MKKIILLTSTLLSLNLSSQVVINEVAVKPGSSSTASADQSLKNCATPTDGKEYIELYNTSSCSAVDISCYFLATPNGASSGAGGTFRFPAGTTIPPLGFISIGGPLSSATIKMNTFCSGASSSYLQTSLSRWFIDNAEAYVALYDANGNALDVVYWTFSAGQSNRWNNATYPGLFNAPANIPNIPGTCSNVASLAGPSAFSAGILNYAGAGPNLNTVICRSQDGGSTWITNATPTINSCNGACAVANPFQTLATLTQPSCSSNNGSITITPSPAGAYTYTWSPNVSSTNSATNLAGGTYSISVALGGCQKDTVITLNTFITPTLSVNSATYCVGNSATLIASGASNYNWSPATGLNTTTGATVTASPTVTTTYTITGVTGTCSTTATTTITVNSLPVITVNSGTICAGQQTLTLTAGGASSYTWSPAMGLSAASGTTVIASPTVTTTYTITGTDVNTCTNTINSVVTVNQTPTITVNPATVCGGGNATLTASGALTYTWSPAIGLNTTTGATVTANPTVTTNYTITSTDANGCTNLDTTSVFVVTTPTINVNNAIICLGNATSLTASGANTYTWNPATGLNTTISATVTANPTVTTTYTVTGTAGTCTASTIATLTVNNLPVIAVNSGTICAGQQTTTLTASGASSYTWGPSTGLSGAFGTTVIANPTITTTYTIIGTDANTCINAINSVVTVNQTPTITVNAATICGGGNASLTAGGASTYTWSPATGLSTTTGATVTASPTVTTNYTITATDVNGCINTNTTSVAIVTSPTINVNNSVICLGNATSLTASGANTYTWNPATGLSTTTSATVTANPTVTTTYTITGASGTCTASTTATLTVNNLPVIAVNSGTICAGQQTATLTVSGTSLSYTWSPATGLSATSGATVIANPTVTTTYTIAGTDANTCINVINSIVTVHQVPAISISSTKDSICSGQNISLSTSGATNYTWMPGGIISSSLNVSPVNSSTYSVIGSSLSCTSLVETYTIVVNPLPKVTGSVVPYSSLCGANNGGVPKIVVSGGTPAYNYQWYNGSISIPNATKDSLNNVGPGTYSVLITDSKGCVATGGTTTFTVTGSGLVTASITPIYTQEYAPVNVLFTNGSTGATTYNWNFGNGTTSTQQYPSTVSYTNAGTYSVTLIANNGNCSDTTYAIVVADVATSIVMPNIFSPNGDAINDAFFINCTGIKSLTCAIYNRWGQHIYSITSVNQSWNGEMINGNKAVEGTYFYLLEASGFDGKNYSLKGNITLIR
jgi:gliding motility-associated-like protein